ncbi:hypothetical protein BIY37_07030 [Candidatus Brocadia sapporoensis]|uniref:Uncharacterized protein n=1 Tax=Candidatus Brocadia sapporoensis TaxID=392547 RepID=A0A1V6LZY4_9BACT|nr:hypothetical protein BIY37_07030 [Candidatus Brocadia sapporoensis]GJQ24787.1 MAG: hypothetical protein HBSAPP01_25770 [Candidatus Brocadia sapporoensis]
MDDFSLQILTGKDIADPVHDGQHFLLHIIRDNSQNTLIAKESVALAFTMAQPEHNIHKTR